MNYAWNWSVLMQEPYTYWLVIGVAMTFAISLSAWLLALCLGTLIGMLASSAHMPRVAAAFYISLFRNIPLLLQLFLWFFVVPQLLPEPWGHWLKRDLPYPEVFTSILALGLFTSARVAVQVSAGLRAVPAGQIMAGLAGGMTKGQIHRLILLPQGARIILPTLTSEFLTIFKNSSVALTIGVYELTAQTQQIESYTYQGFEAFTAATVIYVAIALLVTTLMRQIERRTAIPGTSGVA